MYRYGLHRTAGVVWYQWYTSHVVLALLMSTPSPPVLHLCAASQSSVCCSGKVLTLQVYLVLCCSAACRHKRPSPKKIFLCCTVLCRDCRHTYRCAAVTVQTVCHCFAVTATRNILTITITITINSLSPSPPPGPSKKLVLVFSQEFFRGIFV